MKARDLKLNSPAELSELELPYINAARTSPLDIKPDLPTGYAIGWCREHEDVPDNAIRIGQCRVHQGDPQFILYAKPVGRPPKDGPGQTRKSASFTLPLATISALDNLVRSTGKSKADIIAESIDIYARSLA